MCFLYSSTDKELAAAKERQEIELAAQRATLQEQRTHIDILDTALTNAQGNVVRLEEEVMIQLKLYLVPRNKNILLPSVVRNKCTWKEWVNFNEHFRLFKRLAIDERRLKDN